MAKSTDSFSFECPRCQTMITVGAEASGQTLQCKNCSGNLVVPGSSATLPDAFENLFAIEGDSPDAQPTATRRENVDREKQPDGERAEVVPMATESETDITAWDLMADLEANSHKLEASADPFAADDNAPLRLDDITGGPDIPDQFRIKCPVCDSVMFASSTLIGHQIQCSDCFTMIDVVVPTKPASTKPESLDRSLHKSPAESLTAFPELGPDAGQEPIGDDYGLASATEDMLKPRAETLSPELMDLVSRSYPASSAADTAAPAAPTARAMSSSTAPTPVTGLATLPPTPKFTKPVPGAAELPYVAPPLPPMERLTVSESFKWPEQFLNIFRDLNALQFAGIIAIILSLGYIVSDFGLYLWRYTENDAFQYRIFGAGVLGIAGGMHFVAMLLSGVMVNQAVEGAAHKRNVFHPPELGVMELSSSFLVVGVSFWAGMLPGVVLGQLFWGATSQWWMTYVVAFGTAFLLAPIGILGAYYNGSALQIVSSEVFQSVRHQTAGWIRFYSWMGLWILLFCLAWMLRVIPPTFVGSTLCGIVQAASLLLMGRTIGLLAQAFINFWIDADED